MRHLEVRRKAQDTPKKLPREPEIRYTIDLYYTYRIRLDLGYNFNKHTIAMLNYGSNELSPPEHKGAYLRDIPRKRVGVKKFLKKYLRHLRAMNFA